MWTTKAEFIAFLEDKEWFPDGASVYDEDVFLVGEEEWESPDPTTFPDDKKIKLLGGVFYFGEDLTARAVPLESRLKAWRKAQKTAYLQIQIPKEHVEELRLFLNERKGKVC